VDPNLRPVPVGAAGELLIGGKGVARGYLGREQLTDERFIPNPFPGNAATRLYRTGDLARYLPDGNIELLGRIDHQVKIRGHRVELGEIEALLNDHPGVRECVVLFKELTHADKTLVAYVIPRQGQAPTAQRLRQYAQEKLPEHMVPAQIIFMTAFPQTPNKKIDRNAFPDPGIAGESSAVPENSPPPVTVVEDALAAIWKELLRAPQVGRDDKFFDLGGHSMLAMQLVSRVRKRFNVDLPLRNIFEHQTLGALAEVIEVLLWSASAKAPHQPIPRREVVEV
jgi:acyl carrier protein